MYKFALGRTNHVTNDYHRHIGYSLLTHTTIVIATGGLRYVWVTHIITKCIIVRTSIAVSSARTNSTVVAGAHSNISTHTTSGTTADTS